MAGDRDGGLHLKRGQVDHAHRPVLLVGDIGPASIPQNRYGGGAIAHRHGDRLAEQGGVVAEFVQGNVDNADRIGVVIRCDEL